MMESLVSICKEAIDNIVPISHANRKLYMEVPPRVHHLIVNSQMDLVKYILQKNVIWTNILQVAHCNNANKVIDLLFESHSAQLDSLDIIIYAFQKEDVSLIKRLIGIGCGINYYSLRMSLRLSSVEDCIDIYSQLASRLKPLCHNGAVVNIIESTRLTSDQICHLLKVTSDNGATIESCHERTIIGGLLRLRESPCYSAIFDLFVKMGFLMALDNASSNIDSIVIDYLDRTFCKGVPDIKNDYIKNDYINLIQVVDVEHFKKYVPLCQIKDLWDSLYTPLLHDLKYNHVIALLEMGYVPDIDKMLSSHYFSLPTTGCLRILSHPSIGKFLQDQNGPRFLHYKDLLESKGIGMAIPVNDSFKNWCNYIHTLMDGALMDLTTVRKGHLVKIKWFSPDGHFIKEMIVRADSITVRPDDSGWTVSLSNGFIMAQGPYAKVEPSWIRRLGYDIKYKYKARRDSFYVILFPLVAPYSLHDQVVVAVRRTFSKSCSSKAYS